jgi:hypothetical protein
MSLSAEEIQKSLEASMLSMQIQMENDHKALNEKIANLEKIIKKKDDEIKELKDSMLSKKTEDEIGNKLISELNTKIRDKEKEISDKVEEHQKDAMEISNLKNQISQKTEVILQLEMDKKKLNEKIKSSENQMFVLQKKLDNYEEEKVKVDKKFEEKDNIIKEKDKNIEELNEKIKKMEENNKSLLIYIKEVKEKEELLNKEKEELKITKEKLKQEIFINQEKKEEKKKNEKIEEKKESNKENSKSFDGQEKLIIDLLCEFLLKLNNSQYFISVFDLLNKSCKQFDELNFFIKLNSSRHESMNDIVVNFFDSINSYFSIAKEKATLNDFLQQKSFKFAQLEKDDIDIIKKITGIKLTQNVSILDIYLKKKELFFKSKEFIFNLLKGKILASQENDIIKKNFGKEIITEEKKDIFLNITTPPLELEVDFDKLLKQDYALVKYQVDNVFSKLRELTLKVSKFPVFLLYSLTVNCQNLNTLKIEFIKDEESIEKNKKNIEIMNEICPKLISYLKEMTCFSLINLPFLDINLPDISASLKNSKITKLTLINCFQSKDGIMQFIPYFSLSNKLTEINLSHHQNISIPTELGTSLLNYNMNKNLVSINFNDCGLKESDIKCIANYLISSNSLTFCDLGKNILSQLSCSTLGYCILKTTSLETLNLNECGINGEFLLFLFNGKGSKVLKHINLNGNEFGDIGLVSLCAFMKASPLLESIELEKCGGTDMGFKYIVSTIQENDNNKIKYINFHNNQITDVSLEMLKKFNDYFRNKKVVFALDKIICEKDNDENKYGEIECVMFT